MRRIEAEAGGQQARFVLRDDLAPQSVEAFWATLPIEAALHFGIRSGDACYCEITAQPLADLPIQPELGVVSMYRGWLFVHPVPGQPWCEVLFSYGLAEHRWPTGRRPVTPIAEPAGDVAAFCDALRSLRHSGDKLVRLRAMDSSC